MIYSIILKMEGRPGAAGVPECRAEGSAGSGDNAIKKTRLFDRSAAKPLILR